jgi:hypothetical protein
MEVGVFLEPSRPVAIWPLPLGYGYGPYGKRWNPCDDDEDDLRFVSIGAALI